jgi:hypothetical protein
VASYAVPFLPISLPETSVKFISSPETVRHVLHLARSEMMHVRRPDLEWYHSHKTKPAGQGVYGVWSAGNLDGWVGADGPLVRECIGQSRWKELDRVPHAFCLGE